MRTVLSVIALCLASLSLFGCSSEDDLAPLPEATETAENRYKTVPPWPADSAGQDRPSVVALADGTVWIACQSWNGSSDGIELLRLDDTGLSEPTEVHRAAQHVFGTALALDGAGRVHVIWSERSSSGFALRERLFSPSSDGQQLEPMGPAATVLEQPGVNLLQPVVATDPDGRLALVLQSVGPAGLGVLALGFDGDLGWSSPAPMHLDSFSNWAPAVAARGPGRFVAVWDSAADGDYDILLAELSLSDGELTVSGRQRVTDTPRFEAHASVAVAGERTYVAYEVAGTNWGREGSVNKLDQALHNERRVEILALENGQVAPLAHPFMKGINDNLKDNCEKPTLYLDGNGNLVLGFRGMPLPVVLQDPGSKQFQAFIEERGGGGVGWRTSIWFAYVSMYDGKSWGFRGHRQEGVPDSNGRGDVPLSFCALPRGGAAAVTVGDKREREQVGESEEIGALYGDGISWWYPVSEQANRVTGVRVAKGEPVGPLPTGDWKPLPAWRDPAPRDVLPAPVVTRGDGSTLQLALGDLHRHTDLSRCSSNWDGPFSDAARYSFDVGGLQFLAVTDHFEHMTAFDWWRNRGMMEAWNANGRMVDLVAYERSDNQTGHRNVVAGGDTLPVVGYRRHYHPPRDAERADRPAELWSLLEGYPVITIPHTPAGMFSGNPAVFDWLSFEPEFDRLVEIYQGYRGGSEVKGGPLAIDVPHEHRFAQPGLDGGLHFGFIASSDHQSSYGAFAGTWVTGLTRTEVFEGLHSRLTFASTARMALYTEWNGVAMGQAAWAAPGATTGLRVFVDVFERELLRVELIVDGKLRRSMELSGHSADFVFETADLNIPESGMRYAYVRVLTTDQEVGWSSPIRLGPDANYPPDGPPGKHAYGPELGRFMEMRPGSKGRDPLWQRWEDPAASDGKR